MTAAPATTVLTALNKCLARSNKSRPPRKATKRRNNSASVWKPKQAFELVHIAKLILGSREIIIGALIALAMVLAAPAIEMLK